jgi:ribosomal protein S18 acetylase RimI-like enzyme
MIRLSQWSEDSSLEDLEFLTTCLLELNSNLERHTEAFGNFLRDLARNDAATEVLIAWSDENRVGMMTINRFAMPRYVGFGYEVQEIVVAQSARSRGIGQQLLEAVIERYRANPATRKVVVRSNDPRSQALYARVYGGSDLISFQTFVHKI